MRMRFALAVLALAVPVVGCFSSGSWGGGFEGGTRTTRTGSAASSINYISHDNRKEVLLLIEGSATSNVSSGNPAHGAIHTPTGRAVEWSCPARRGVLKEMRIDDTVFPLEAGRVFHIDVRGEQVLVRQLDLDPDELVRGPGSLRENLRSSASKHPTIAGFCERTNPPTE